MGIPNVDSATPTAGIKLACLGDAMPAGTALDAVYHTGTEQVWPGIEGADAVVMNLECPLTDAPQAHQNKRYSFRCTRDVLDVFDRRFVFGLANNHIFDYGERGLLETIEALDTRNFLHAGAGRNLEEAARPVMLDCAGVRLGVLCAADPRYHAATNTSAGTFPADSGILRESIRALRESADITVVSIHSGQEFLPVPSPRQQQLSELCLEEGARIVAFHHAHCISGIRRDRRGVVFFGTGNYIFPRGDTPRRYVFWHESAVWQVTLNVRTRQIEKTAVLPVVLDDGGLPHAAPERAARKILDRVSRYSDRICASGRLGWWRLREMARPVYLWMNLVNYIDIARRNGIRATLRALAGGIAAQLGGRQDRGSM